MLQRKIDKPMEKGYIRESISLCCASVTCALKGWNMKDEC
jgi:hypothetical protein